MKKFKVHVKYRVFYNDTVFGFRSYDNEFNATLIRDNGTSVLKHIFDLYNKILYIRTRQGNMFGSQSMIEEFSIECTGTYE